MYAVVVWVVAVVSSFGSVSAAAAATAAVVHVVVGVIAGPAFCRPSAQNTRHNYMPGTNFIFFFAHYNQNILVIFFLGTSSHRDRGLVGVLPFVYALLLPLLFICTL